MIVDQPPFLDFRGYRTSALGTGQQSRKQKIMLPAYVCAAPALFQNALNPVPQFHIYDWLVLPLVNFAIPFKLACVNPVVQNIGNGAGRDWCVGLSVGKTGSSYIRSNYLKGSLSLGIPFENLLYHRCPLLINGNHLATLRIRDISIPEGCLTGINPLLRLLTNPLAGFLGEIFGILLGHQNLDAEHELCRRAGIAGKNLPLFRKMDFHVQAVNQFINRHPVFQIAKEAVRFLNQNCPDAFTLPNTGYHLVEIMPPCLLCGFYIDKFLNDVKSVTLRILPQ
ncbi:MAG: hypothetical protein OXF24_02555 [Hyphomicrobiales bacterium]|nr:hypothetical protein [Hyphomicrobiales bacterium]